MADWGWSYRDGERVQGSGFASWVDALEDAARCDPEEMAEGRLWVGPLTPCAVADYLDEGDVADLRDCDDRSLRAWRVVETVSERHGETVADGGVSCDLPDNTDLSALTDAEVLAWASQHFSLDPDTYYALRPALPLAWREGEWVLGGDDHGDDHPDDAAVVTYASEPSPETGDVGWCWWALGRMGSAPTLREAMRAAEAEIQRRMDRILEVP